MKRRLETVPEHRRSIVEDRLEKLISRSYQEGEKEERITVLVGLVMDALEMDEYWTVCREIEDAEKVDVFHVAQALDKFGLIQFPVLRQNENDTWYDRRGRIVFTCSKGLPGVGFSRPEWNEIKDLKGGTVERKVTEDFLPGGPRERSIVYEEPFDRCDREQDYATVWKEFERRKAK